jgi:hypothetical protein
VHGTTLLHLAAYFDELEIAEWLLDRGMHPDARAAIGANEDRRSSEPLEREVTVQS